MSNTFKKIARAIAIFAVVFVVFFVTFWIGAWFITQEFHPLQWESVDRASVYIPALLLAFIITAGCMFE